MRNSRIFATCFIDKLLEAYTSAGEAGEGSVAQRVVDTENSEKPLPRLGLPWRSRLARGININQSFLPSMY